MNNHEKLLSNVVEGKRSWAEVKSVLSEYNVHDSQAGKKDTRGGKLFEVFTKYYFLASPTESCNFRNVWLFEETPILVRKKLNLGSVDYGVDLVLEDAHSNYWVVQCKFRNDETSSLNWSSDKIANLFAYCPDAYGYIVFSNAANLDAVSRTRYSNRFSFYSAADLYALEKHTILEICRRLTGQPPKARKHLEPLPHQLEAINSCVKRFEHEERGQLILPCGAGKTLTALWIKEKLNSHNTLVLVPSLALLRQLKNDWAKERITSYQYLCVCSEDTINQDVDGDDTTVTNTYELGINVTTDPAEIKQFLLIGEEERVIFSTYHSLSSISEAICGTSFQFDLIFCDEAHKTAGVGMNKFSLVHDNTKVPSQRRLYATATPRIVKESLKKKLGEDLKYAYDMNDPETFGEEFYRMTFKEAIESDILVDYKIIAIGVKDAELKKYIDERRFVDTKVTVDEMANNYALEHIMSRYGASHALTFHSRVALAENFSTRHRNLFPDTIAYSVNGKQTTSHRNLVLEEFKRSEKAVVSNARCLTEGVDVPTIDLVYFCDPKSSKVDIVQAVGRALRKNRINPDSKKEGLVVVPVFHSDRDSVGESISNSSFKNLLQVIRSLCDQDERLQDEINRLALGKGRRNSGKISIEDAFFSEEQGVILLEGFEQKLKDSLFGQIVERASNNWDLFFLQLQEYISEHNEYPNEKESPELYRWVAQQRVRRKSGALKNEEIRKLDSIDFIWDQQEWKWNRMYEELVNYAVSNEFEPSKEEEPELYKWYKVVKAQVAKGKLRKDRLERFNRIAFSGSSIDRKWASQYERLVQFRKQNPERWPRYDRNHTGSEESKLGVFCQMVRKGFKNNDLSTYWFDMLAKIDFSFEGGADTWNRYYNEVKEQIASKDKLSVDDIGVNAYTWLTRNHKKLQEGSLSDGRAKKIQELGLDRFFITWDEVFDRVRLFVEVNGRTPTYKADKQLYSWLQSQRTRYQNGNLHPEQIEKLGSVKFDLEGQGKEANEQKWLYKLDSYQSFLEQNGREPSYFNGEGEKQLYNWAAAQRAAMAGNLRNRKPLSEFRVERLNAINFNWVGEGRKGANWNDKFKEFRDFVSREGLQNLPSIVDGKPFGIYRWWYRQITAYKQGNLDQGQVECFLELGINLAKVVGVEETDDKARRYEGRVVEVT
ncbi:DEAD/DEAH box helicase [Pontibacter korlensis]